MRAPSTTTRAQISSESGKVHIHPLLFTVLFIISV
ncbi:hypothetical protein TSAR_014868 [Trichomalopsis sarcophagae]|uniref:Uncharacterized protein n=1 Tax=Trichomalopsis sarcophagae TaxID=543379 RepID=A0A232EDM8_9HYME|nr:hypothetical protein TSAR_014868 [Trichomalopsis sarcophagae]